MASLDAASADGIVATAGDTTPADAVAATLTAAKTGNLAALAAGVAQPAAFAASFAARALMSAVGVADASLVFPRAGAIGSMLLSAALAGLALAAARHVLLSPQPAIPLADA